MVCLQLGEDEWGVISQQQTGRKKTGYTLNNYRNRRQKRSKRNVVKRKGLRTNIKDEKTSEGAGRVKVLPEGPRREPSQKKGQCEKLHRGKSKWETRGGEKRRGTHEAEGDR